MREFGDVLRPDGTLDRKKLAAIVFADPSRRKRLEVILHPAIRARFDARLDALTREGFEGIVVFDAPVMIESGGYKNMDRLIVVVGPFRALTFVDTAVVDVDTAPELAGLADFAPLPAPAQPTVASATVQRHAPMNGRRLMAEPRHRAPASRGTISGAPSPDTRC